MSEQGNDEAVAVGAAGEPEQGISSTVKIGAVIVLLMGAVTAILFNTGATEVLVYSKLVNEVMAKPGDFAGRELRVEGELKQGSIKFREQPCEWQFVLHKDGKEMPVQYSQCVVPDTFRDGMGISVTVQGKLAAGGASFEANQVIAKCPSKYEMKERAKKGEVMPHAATAPKPQG
jgi:cytochrome c-type biogenesis protein CcmE